MDLKSKIILISGPTASGKSNFSIKLAKKINGEIINADSMQVYKELKILSARLNVKDYQKIKHHLYGFHSVKNNFSTGDWLKIAIKKIKEIKLKKLEEKNEILKEQKELKILKEKLQKENDKLNLKDKELKIKEETKATIRCIPFNEDPKGLKCVYSGKKAKHEVIYAKAY